MRLKVIIAAVVLVALGGTADYLYGMSEKTATPSAAMTTDKLIMSPQEGHDSVTIDSVTLSKPGYVVIRGSDGKRLGQVIEISRYLTPGTYTDIQIALGDFYTYSADDQLIAIIYADEGDQSFSGLDEPATDSSGNATAVFVKTGQPVPASVFQEVAANGGAGMETVRYTNSGFQPKKLTVPVGTMVEFINQSDTRMWVASNVHPGHDLLPTFDEFKAVEKGQSYMYTFDKKGTWPYHDHENPAVEGVIVVE